LSGLRTRGDAGSDGGRRRAREEADRKRETERVAKLERLAGEETVREPRNRFVAFIPFGAGQFQNGDTTLGWVFLGAESALVVLGTAVVPFYIAERNAMNASYDPALEPDATRRATAHRDNALRLQLVNLVSFGLFAATAITGIVQANVVFVPEKVKTQKRDPRILEPPPEPQHNGNPKHESGSLRMWPSVVGVPSGAVGGLEGRF
jgi:hypothetical protein